MLTSLTRSTGTERTSKSRNVMVRAAPCEIRTILLTRVSIVATPKIRDYAHQTNRISGACLVPSGLRAAIFTPIRISRSVPLGWFAQGPGRG